ncbi:hypothetical protein SDC9_93722 [bioreactor metagenome]|uniref:Uncharacterized protein n=1 Tax=bioreactor metagenome TaxID=1076179 RepID=A0A645ABF1_9ZZZZ
MKGDLGLARRLFADRPLKEQVALAADAQAVRAAVPQRPAQRVKQVALAAAVRPDDRREPRR